MSQRGCPQEANILKAVRAGIWEESITTHIAACPTCRELARTARWMQSLAKTSANAPPLADPARIWWRAQLSEKQAKAERTQEVFEWTEIISASILCAAFAAWFIWDWSAIQTLAISYLAGSWPHSWLAASLIHGTAPAIFSLSAAILSILAIILAFPLLVRD